jgi:hypothetical protein
LDEYDYRFDFLADKVDYKYKFQLIFTRIIPVYDGELGVKKTNRRQIAHQYIYPDDFQDGLTTAYASFPNWQKGIAGFDIVFNDDDHFAKQDFEPIGLSMRIYEVRKNIPVVCNLEC